MAGHCAGVLARIYCTSSRDGSSGNCCFGLVNAGWLQLAIYRPLSVGGFSC